MKRWLAITALLIVVLCFAWLWWNHVANRQLGQAKDAVRARHEPIDPEDFNPAPLPPERNAAALLQSAASAVASNVDSPSMSNYTFNDAPPYTPLWYALANTAVAADGRALALARQARAIDSADWGWRFHTPVALAFFGAFNSQRNLANLLGDAALHAHVHGDDAEAIERVLDELHQSEIVSNGQGLLIGRLVGIGVEAIAVERIEVLAPGLHISGAAFNPPPATMPTMAVRREVIVALIKQLLDDRSEHEGIRHAILGERMAVLDLIRDSGTHSYILGPLFNLEIAHVITAFDEDIRAALQTNLPASIKAPSTPPGFLPSRERSRLTRIMSTALEPAFNRYVLSERRVLSDRFCAAISLAAQLYRVDHGALPADLAALVPAYLPAVPRNPVLDDGSLMEYIALKGTPPGAADRPMITFVSDTPAPAAANAPATPQYGWTAGNRQWRDVTRWEPPAPATAPAE
ncbi:MAG TPA: hypothetical protein VLI90_08355 [Tepidisphaeraceae bacterium]|nr:hypothetical protein [Tepidisphaeraceae bacterium]